MNKECSTLYKSAKLSYDNNDFDTAKKLFEEVILKFPDTHEASYANSLLLNIAKKESSNDDGSKIYKDKYKGFKIGFVGYCIAMLGTLLHNLSPMTFTWIILGIGVAVAFYGMIVHLTIMFVKDQ